MRLSASGEVIDAIGQQHGRAAASDIAPLVGLYDQAQLTCHFRRLVGTTLARYGRSARAVS